MKSAPILILSAYLTLPILAQAQSFTGHLFPGAEELKGPSLPPPGFYVRNYTIYYGANRLNLPNGSKMPIDFKASVYADVVRALWVTDLQVLGGNFFADAFVPFTYTSLRVAGTKSSNFGVGDLFVEPAGISWHGDRWDAGAAYAVWIPNGDSKLGSPKPGKGFWGHMLTAGATAYLDDKKTWALSILNRYEINDQEKDTHITPGNQWTLEWSLSKRIQPTLEVALGGYYQGQTTKDSGAGASKTLDQVYAVGPEVNVFWPGLGVFTSLCYNYELAAKDRPQGQTLLLKVTRKF
ncbi:MAG: transporter [Verrucomicrobiota bacterium]